MAASVLFDLSPRAQQLYAVLKEFCENDCKKAEPVFAEQHDAGKDRWKSPPVMEELKSKAKKLGLWNLYLPKDYKESPGLTNLEYAHMAEIMGKYPLASEACNCSAPDTGNMEVLAKYGTDEQKRKWLIPLMNGEIRSVFFMTEPAVASSDATNIESQIRKDGDYYVINGRKWWSSGVMDHRCKIGIFMGKTAPDDADVHRQQSMILVPMDTPGIKVMRALTVFGYDDAPHGHGEVDFVNVRVHKSNLLLGEGRGFEIAQGRLGPGRIHHCMRSIGVGERAMEAMVARAVSRRAFGKLLAEQATVQKDIADSRIELDAARLLVLHAAHMIDNGGAKSARAEISMIKVYIPNVVLRVLDRAMQVHGGAGVSQDFFLARAYAGMRTLRFADGPDEVHARLVAQIEIRNQLKKAGISAPSTTQKASKSFARL